MPGCGHGVNVACSQDLSVVKCRTMVEKIGKCQHKVKVMCSASLDSVKCQTKVTKMLSCVVHKAEMECWENPKDVKCKTKIAKRLSCKKHNAEVECCKDVKDVKCQTKVSKKLRCGDTSEVACSTDAKSVTCMKKKTFIFTCKCTKDALCHQRKTLTHICPKPALKIKATKLLNQLDSKIAKTLIDTPESEKLKTDQEEVKLVLDQLDGANDVTKLKARLVKVEREQSLAVDPFKTMLGRMSAMKISK